ncbi:hypothetical protein Tco_1254471 [Tanacetum coccineum]
MEKYSVFERKHEKQVQVVKVDSVDLPSDEGIVQVTGNNNRGKLFGEEEGSGIHIVGMHAHAAQHRHNHARLTSVQGRRTEHPTIRHDSFVPISASVVIIPVFHICGFVRVAALEVDAPYRSVIPSMRTKRKLMYDSVNVLEVGSSSKKQSIASKVGLQHESNFPSICNDVLAMEYMCMNPGVDTPEVLLRLAFKHLNAFGENTRRLGLLREVNRQDKRPNTNILERNRAHIELDTTSQAESEAVGDSNYDGVMILTLRQYVTESK